MPALPSFADVESAAERLAGVARRTPVHTCGALDRRTGGRVYLKCESFQRVGAFKFRGAYNTLSRLGDEERRGGVLAYSSGNHAQAVALSAQLLGAAATILMPEDAPELKVAATRGYGAEVITYDRYTQDRAALGDAIADERGMTLVRPFDDLRVIAGQGTAALELVEDVPDLDVLLVPMGGGGLISGCATVIDALSPRTRVVGLEPAERPLGRDLLSSGSRARGEVPRTIADGQQGDQLGELTAEVISARVDEVVGVTDDQLVAAMRVLFERTKSVVEPSGAMGVAALLAGLVPVGGQRVGVILSGGNISTDAFAALLAPPG